MSIEASKLSAGFMALYCELDLFKRFSSVHPINFERVLPFQRGDLFIDDPRITTAEKSLFVDLNDGTKCAVIDAYVQNGLLPQPEGESLKQVIDLFDDDFFDLMGLVYANAGMFKCALRWQREAIMRLEAEHPESVSDTASVYASVGYGLFSLGLFEEAVTWTKSCLGPGAIADMIARAVISCEAELAGGAIRMVERSGPLTRYTVAAFDAEKFAAQAPRLAAAIQSLSPFHHIYIETYARETALPGIQETGYPFLPEFDGGSLVRHKTNLIFATCGLADALIERGRILEARRMLREAALLEPEATIVKERLKHLPP